jgi:hypothetical protein
VLVTLNVSNCLGETLLFLTLSTLGRRFHAGRTNLDRYFYFLPIQSAQGLCNATLIGFIPETGMIFTKL